MSNVIVYDNKYLKLKEVDWDFLDSQQDAMASIHPYPARFINEIPRTLINLIGCPNDSIILDPFCGSGTTLAEAKNSYYDSVGIDLNPIACLISRVRTMNNYPNLDGIANTVVCNAKVGYMQVTAIPNIPNLDHWFKKDIQKAIYSLLLEINKIESHRVHDVLSLALSSIIVRVSNQDSDTRYAAVDNNYTAEDVYKCFLIACHKISEALEHLPKERSVNVTVINEDILQVIPDQIGTNIGLVITSPPYPNAYEYWLYHKYRMWWLGYDPIHVRQYEIGARPHYHKKNGQTEVDFIRQMGQVFGLLQTCLIKGGHICFIVGRSIIRGREIDNAELITTIADNHGLIRVANIERSVAPSKKSFNLSYGKIRTENIVIFRKD